jgi:hypothetical protein
MLPTILILVGMCAIILAAAVSSMPIEECGDKLDHFWAALPVAVGGALLAGVGATLEANWNDEDD